MPTGSNAESDMDKFKAGVIEAMSIGNRLPANERIEAAALVNNLLKELSKSTALVVRS
jgi:hypothetical protein